MSTVPIDHTVKTPDGRYDHTETYDPEAIVEILSDERTLRVFQTTIAPMTVAEIARRCDLPLSTAYRKVDTLVDAGLLECVADGHPREGAADRYVRAVERVTITLRDGIHVQFHLPNHPPG